MPRATLKDAISRFATAFVVAATAIAVLGMLILVQQEYAIWTMIGVCAAFFAGILGALIPTKNKSIYIGLPLFLALTICYLLLASY